VLIALLTVWAAIALSYLSNWPVGFFVGVIAAGCYGLGRVWHRLAARRDLVTLDTQRKVTT
jgi:zinc/manganese transport system permease protein